MERKIILNRIETPDGTILVSHFTHDYRTYTDKNGLEYMVDGGREYLRRSVHKTELVFIKKIWIWLKGLFGFKYVDPLAYTEMSVYDDDSFEVIRESLSWGTYGRDGKQPLKFKKLSDMSDTHIEAIIETQYQMGTNLKKFMELELEYRKIVDILIED